MVATSITETVPLTGYFAESEPQTTALPCATAGVEVEDTANFTEPAALSSSPTRSILCSVPSFWVTARYSPCPEALGWTATMPARQEPLTTTEDSSAPDSPSTSAIFPKSSPTMRSSPETAAPAQ